MPIQQEYININIIKTFGIDMKFNYSYIDINNNIINHIIPYDKRTHSVNNILYYNESYNIFRLEFSIFINKNIHKHIKHKTIAFVENNISSNDSKKR